MIAIARWLGKILTSAKTALNAAHNQRPRMERPLSGGLSLSREWRKCLENSDRNCLRVKYFARGRSDVASLPTVLATWSSRSNSMHFRKHMKATRSGQKREVAPVDAIAHPASADGLFQCRQLTFEPSQPARNRSVYQGRPEVLVLLIASAVRKRRDQARRCLHRNSHGKFGEPKSYNPPEPGCSTACQSPSKIPKEIS